MKTTITLIVSIIVLLGCKSGAVKNKTIQNEPIASVIQPISGLEIPTKIYEVIAEVASKIELPNGGSIEIPENTFVDKEGRLIKGKVNVEWAEFHSLTDILLSGIPMIYDSAGVQHNFISGGMFTIHANQSGLDLEIAEGKELTVNLVSTNDTPCFNFYSLNEETGDWTYKTTKTGTPIAEKQSPETNQKTAKTEPVLIDCEVEYSQFPELKNKNIVAWRVVEELSLDEKNNVEKNVSFLTLQQDDLSYFLDFKRNNGSSIVRVEPFYLEQAKAKSSKLRNNLKEDYSAIKTYYQDVANGKIVRTIALTEMGTHNWDYIMRNFDTQFVNAEFDYGSKVKNPELASLFYISTEANVMMRYNPIRDQKFRFLPKNKGGLIAILPNNEIYVLKYEGFKQIASQPARANYTFHLQPSGVVATSGADVAKIAKSLF